MNNAHFEQKILNRIIDRSVNLWIGLSVVAIGMQLLRSGDAGFGWKEASMMVLMMSVVVLKMMQSRLSVAVKGAWIASVTAGIAYIGILKYGLMAAGFTILPMSVLILALFFKTRAFRVFFAVNLLVLLALAFAFTELGAPMPTSPELLVKNWGHWGIFILCSVMVTLFIGLALLEYKNGLSRTINQLKKQSEEMEQLARYDHLTGLSLLTLAEKRIERLMVNRKTGDQVAVLFIDVDDFKSINDQYGHEAGDCCLKFVAQSIHNVIRSTDVACRIGGDEMVVISSQMTADSAMDLSNRLVAAVSQGVVCQGQHIQLSVSIGISMSPDHGCQFKALRRCADEAMYQAKNDEVRQVVLYRS